MLAISPDILKARLSNTANPTAKLKCAAHLHPVPEQVNVMREASQLKQAFAIGFSKIIAPAITALVTTKVEFGTARECRQQNCVNAKVSQGLLLFQLVVASTPMFLL